MALVQRSCNRITSILTRLNTRSLSKANFTVENDLKKSVFISQSTDIYTNLALEEWIFKNFNFEKHHILMLWKNDPCVVIGRNQNPWSEINFSDLQSLKESGVNIARRSSSGGTVYHDHGNLNMTFFTPKGKYDSKKNNQVVMKSIFREFGCSVDIGMENHLLMRKNKQVSNNAAKLGRENAYHNMSLTVQCSKVNWNIAVEKHDVHIQSSTKHSVPLSKMTNLCEETPDVTVSSLVKAVGWEFLRTKGISGQDGGMELANKQNGFHLVNPTDYWFPGIQEICDNFSSWEWCYGKTPKFNITQNFTVPTGLLHTKTGASASLKVTMTVENGRISDITIFVPLELNSLGFTGEAKVIHSLKGKKFTAQAFEDLEDSLGCLLNEKDRFVTECLKQVMTNA